MFDGVLVVGVDGVVVAVKGANNDEALVLPAAEDTVGADEVAAVDKVPNGDV